MGIQTRPIFLGTEGDDVTRRQNVCALRGQQSDKRSSDLFVEEKENDIGVPVEVIPLYMTIEVEQLLFLNKHYWLRK